jgi:hypothetical protein
MAKQFCQKLWIIYKDLKTMKIKFDQTVGQKTTQKPLTEIKKIGNVVYEFYAQFSQQAIESFFISLEQYQDPVEKTKLIADFMPVAFLHLEERELKIFFHYARNIYLEDETWEADFIENYLNLQQNFYKKFTASFAENLKKHKEYTQKLQQNEKNYPFDPARLIGQFAQIKGNLAEKETTSTITWLQNYFKLKENNQPPSDKEDDSLENLNFLKYIIKKPGLYSNQNLALPNLLSENLLESDNLNELEQQNLSFITHILLHFVKAIKGSPLYQQKIKASPEVFQKFFSNYRLAFISFFRFLNRQFGEKTLQLKAAPDNPDIKKEVYFFCSKIHEIIFALKTNDLLEYFTENLLENDHIKSYFALQPINKLKNLLNIYYDSKHKKLPPDFDLPNELKLTSNNPQYILELLQFGKVNQAKFKKYKDST